MKGISVYLALAFLGACVGEKLLSTDVIPNARVQHRHETLDNNGDFVIDWTIKYDEEIVEFSAMVKTKGWVGFGISPAGGMTGADIVIGGINEDGSTYFSNRHATGSSTPIVDDKETWKFISVSETETHTTLKFSRDFNTCDDQDVPLTNDTTNFIYAFGVDDNISYHTTARRGTFQVLPLDPELPPVGTAHLQSFEIVHTMTMSNEETIYHCTIQKSPHFDKKHHIVAFEPKIISPEAILHTHHYAIFRCTPPEGYTAEEYFENYVGKPGGGCKSPNPEVPNEHCQTMFWTWAVGGKSLIFPDNIGVPVGEDPESSVDYYMFEIHYNNPDKLENVRFETGATIYYTDKIREHDAGILMVAHQTSLGLMIPPKSVGYKTVGHCDPYCTQNYLPKDGINIFALLHHGHLSARRMKLRHFRGDEELSWIQNDDNYDFEYQQTRPMSEMVKVLPGDHLTTECIYDSTWRDGATIGGLATTDEMCQSTFFYYPRANLRECRSELKFAEFLSTLGIGEIQDRTFMYEDVAVLAPPTLAGLRVSEVLNTKIDWSKEFRDQIQNVTSFGGHEGVCYIIGAPDTVPHEVGYPRYKKAFEPFDECAVFKGNGNVFRAGLISMSSAAVSLLLGSGWF